MEGWRLGLKSAPQPRTAKATTGWKKPGGGSLEPLWGPRPGQHSGTNTAIQCGSSFLQPQETNPRGGKGQAHQPHCRASAAPRYHMVTPHMVTPHMATLSSSGASSGEWTTHRKRSKSPRAGPPRGISDPIKTCQVLHFQYVPLIALQSNG